MRRYVMGGLMARQIRMMKNRGFRNSHRDVLKVSGQNTENVERLIQAGRMHKAGMAEIEAAKTDGRWNKAYDSPKNMNMPEDFLKELSKNKKARTFFESLNRANLYSIHWRLQTAKKPETRQKRMQMILEMLERGEKFH